jgi:Flp pilus assembly protein TadD
MSGLKKALRNFNNGDYRKACLEFESYMSKKYQGDSRQDQEMIRMYMVEAYIEHSKELSSEGSYGEAAKQLERAIELQPAYADVHYGLGELYIKLGRIADARECYRNSLEINPNYFKARVKLALTYHNEGDLENAYKQLNECLPATPAFYLDQMEKLLDLVKLDADIEDRKKIFHNLLEERPSSSQVSKQIALEAIQNGDYDSAMNELKKTLSMNPNYPDLHNLLGIAYANKGMTDDAIMEFETALKIHPDYLKARVNMALTFYEKGAKDESLKHLNVVLELDPENELARNLLQELQPVGERR